MHYRISRPIRRVCRAKFIEHQDFRFNDGRKHFQFRSLRDGIVRILNLFQERSEFVEQTRDAFLLDDITQDGDGKVRLNTSIDIPL
jgi:hypothetical protein